MLTFRLTFALLLLTLPDGALVAAPKPLPKAAPPAAAANQLQRADILGEWEMCWNSTLPGGTAVFLDNGSYSVVWGGSIWQGNWRYDQATQTMTVDEYPVNSIGPDGVPTTRLVWSVVFSDSARREGKVNGGVFRLDPRKPPMPDF